EWNAKNCTSVNRMALDLLPSFRGLESVLSVNELSISESCTVQTMEGFTNLQRLRSLQIQSKTIRSLEGLNSLRACPATITTRSESLASVSAFRRCPLTDGLLVQFVFE